MWGAILTWHLLAQATSDITLPTWIDAIARLGGAGVLGVLLYFLLVKSMPAQEKRHETERTEWRSEREAWLDYMRKRDVQFERVLVGVEVLLKAVQEQNARVAKLLERIEHERHAN